MKSLCSIGYAIWAWGGVIGGKNGSNEVVCPEVGTCGQIWTCALYCSRYPVHSGSYLIGVETRIFEWQA